MICPDCGFETDHLIKGIRCVKCRNRVNNSKQRGLKYVPLIELKGTEEYDRAIMLRKAMSKSKQNKETKKNISKNSNITTIIKKQPEVSEAQSLVIDDLTNFVNKKKINIQKNKFPIDLFFENLYSMCQVSNYIDDYLDEKNMYDTIIVDYLHELKVFSPTTNFALIGEKIGLVQQQRTTVDYELDKYFVIKPIIDYLKTDKTFLDKLQETRISLLELLEKQKDPKYVSTTPSLQEYDFVVKPKDDVVKTRTLNVPTKKLNKYVIKPFQCKNLYGNSAYQPFVYKNDISADSAETAKQQFIQYINEAFPNLIYKTNEIEAALSSSFKKECL